MVRNGMNEKALEAVSISPPMGIVDQKLLSGQDCPAVLISRSGQNIYG